MSIVDSLEHLRSKIYHRWGYIGITYKSSPSIDDYIVVYVSNEDAARKDIIDLCGRVGDSYYITITKIKGE